MRLKLPMKDIPKINYFFIDESGKVENPTDKFLILGCVISGQPEKLEKELGNLRKTLNTKYFARYRDALQRTGFHASANHFDIYAKFIEKLNILPIRTYFAILKKDSAYFEKISAGKSSAAIYNFLLGKLLEGRLVKRKDDKNIIFIEQDFDAPSEAKKIMREEELNLLFQNIAPVTEVHLTEKNDLIAIVDYMVNVLSKNLNKDKVDAKDVENFNMLQDKIGLIYRVDRKEYFEPRKGGFSIDDVKK